MATKSWNRWSQCLYSTRKVDLYCGHSGQACFPDLLRFRSKVAKSLFELEVIGVPWMHGVIVMCFVLAPGPGIVVKLRHASIPFLMKL